MGYEELTMSQEVLDSVMGSPQWQQRLRFFVRVW